MWKNTPNWQKYGIIFLLIYIVAFILALIYDYRECNGFFCLPVASMIVSFPGIIISGILGLRGASENLVLFLGSSTFYFLIGSLISSIVAKIKSRKQNNLVQ